SDGEIEVKMRKPLPFTQKTFVIANEVGIVRRVRDSNVQRLVRLGQRLKVPAFDRLHVLVIRLANSHEVRVGTMQGRETGHCTLNEVESGDVLRKLLDLKRRHQRGPVRQSGDQSLTDK